MGAKTTVDDDESLEDHQSFPRRLKEQEATLKQEESETASLSVSFFFFSISTKEPALSDSVTGAAKQMTRLLTIWSQWSEISNAHSPQSS